jgi:hypothetical protein
MDNIEKKVSEQQMSILIPILIFVVFILPMGLLLFFHLMDNISPILRVFMIGLPTITLIFIYFLHLKVIVENEVIRYKMFPLHWSYCVINRAEIESMQVKQVNPLAEFGGWGVRYKGNSTLYILDGKDVLEIRLKNNKIILLGIDDSNGMFKNYPLS